MKKFITLEGIEGVGKTSNLRYIKELLEESGHNCVVTREPGGTNLGESLRGLLLHSCFHQSDSIINPARTHQD
jgi:dTMP kinase